MLQRGRTLILSQLSGWRACAGAVSSTVPGLPADARCAEEASTSAPSLGILQCGTSRRHMSAEAGRQVAPDWYMALNTLRDNPGARQQPKRVGRGDSSDHGKTCGRGASGQKKRSGNKPALLFEGGQTGLRMFPKVNVRPTNPTVYDWVNLERVTAWIKYGKLDPSKVITMKDLRDSGCAPKTIKWGIKLLARGAGDVSDPLHLQVSSCSAQARAAVEKAGGSVTTVYYSKLGLRALLKPENFAKQGKTLPGPVRAVPPRLDGRFQAMGQIPPVTTLPPALAAPPPGLPTDFAPQPPSAEASGGRLASASAAG